LIEQKTTGDYATRETFFFQPFIIHTYKEAVDFIECEMEKNNQDV
jgi:hypothetical protein